MLRILKRLKGYIPVLILVILFSVGQSVGSLFVPRIMSKIIDNGIIPVSTGAALDYGYILRQGLAMLGVTVLSSASAICAAYCVSHIATGIAQKTRRDVFEKVQSFSLTEYHKFGGASLITRTTNDVTQTQNIIFLILRFGMMIPIMFIGGIVMAVTQSPRASSVMLVSIPLMVIGALVLGKIAFKLFETMQTRLDKMTVIMRENLSGVRVVRAFNQEETEKTRFDKSNRGVVEMGLKANRLMAILMPVVMLLINVSIVAVVFIVAFSTKSGDAAEIGSMLAIIEYITMIMMSVIFVAMMFTMFPRGSASAKRIHAVLDEPITVGNSGTIIALPEFDRIVYDGVSFSFDGADDYAVSGVSFTAKKGETVAIIGSTGSGKSTLMNLLPRFYNVTEGDIKLGDVSINDIELNALRGIIGAIPQKVNLFRGTIAGNLRYGKENADEDEMLSALEIAQAKNFVENKDGKLDAVVEQGGSNFSGGQKQRLAIARAIVRKPLIYIFDDSFSALDFKTDLALRQALRKVTAESFVFIVAQRVGTIVDADKILVLEEGRLVGEGTHAELIQHNKVYKEIALSQLSEEELSKWTK